MQLTPILASRLEKVAIDNGFDRELPNVGDWLAFSSTQCPMQIWLSVSDDGSCLAAISQANVAAALSADKANPTKRLPEGAVVCLGALDIPSLHHLVRRAFQLSRTLPDEPLHVFYRKVQALPRTTEAERLVVQRVGQTIFREALLDYWRGCCAVTGVGLTAVLRASHMKPWAHCENDAERLNVFNGLLLVANLDALFDRGLISFSAVGQLLISEKVLSECREQLGLHPSLRLQWVTREHVPFLEWHRDRVYDRS
jgi:hypothetical protein